MGFNGGGLGGNEPEWLEAVALYESTLAKHDMPASGLAIYGHAGDEGGNGKGEEFCCLCGGFVCYYGCGTDGAGVF